MSSNAQDYFGLTKFQESSRFTAIAVTSGGKVMAAMWGKGIYTTTNSGTNWSLSINGMTNLYVTKLHITSAGKIYASTYGGGVYLSADNGDSWSQINGGLTNLNVKTVMVHPSGAIFAGTFGGGIFMSKDNGASWTQTFKGFRYRDVSSLVTSKNGYVIAGTFGSGIYMSRDTGKTWKESNSGVTNDFITDLTINNAGDILAATNGRGVLESPNNGISWAEKDSADLADLNISAITLNSDQELIAGTVSNGIYYWDKTTYLNWRMSTVGYLGITAMTTDKNGNVYAAQSGMPILKSTDKGRTWKDMNWDATENQTIAITKENGLIIACTDNIGIRRSTDFGLTWNSNYSVSNTFNDGVIDYNSTIFIATAAGLSISADMGLNYSDNPSIGSRTVNSITESPVGVLIATTSLHFPPSPPSPPRPPEYDVYKSTDRGLTFDSIPPPSTFENQVARYCPNGKLYVSTDEPSLYSSSNDGQNWTKLNGIPEKIETIAFNSHDDVFCGTAKGIYVSTNAGQNWTFTRLGFQGTDNHPYVKKIAVNKDDVIFAAVNYTNLNSMTNSGVWRSFDNGVTWDSVNSSIRVSLKSSIAVNPEGDLIMLSGGIHKAVNPSTLLVPVTVQPSNGVYDQDIFPAYKWKKTDKAELYQVEVSLNEDFSFIVDDATIGDTTFTGEFQLDNNTKYYWHVRSKVHNAVSPWSAAIAFTTKLPSPTLLSPKSDSVGVEVAPVMMWYEVTDAKYYKIQISSDKNFSNIVYEKDSISLTDQKSNKLAALTEYWWRAMCFNDQSRSEWSAPWKFKTTLAPPDLVKPANAEMDVDIKPTFLWKKVNTVQKYQIQISANADFTNAITDSVLEGDTIYVRASLDYNKAYYWRVKSQSANLSSDWSDVWTFTTSIAPPVLVSPANNAVAVGFNPILDWEAVASCDHYHFQAAKDMNFLNIIAEGTLGDTTQAKIGPLDSYTSYYWRVRAKIGTRIGLWSEIRSFKTNLSLVTLRSPGNNTTSHPTEINLQWFPKAGATNYFLQVATDDSFNDLVISKDSIAGLAYNYPSFEKSTKYFWRVKTWNADGTSEWSEIWNFSTGTNSPALRLPENSAIDIPVNYRFVWDQMGGMTKYHIQIAKNDKFDSPITDQQDLSIAEFNAVSMDISTLYYWRVRAFNGSQYTDWSAVWTFTTKNNVSVREDQPMPIGAYPNPFDNEFTIDYRIENPGLVRITLIDALGNTAGTLSNEYQLPGNHSARFSGNVPAGSYFIKLESGGNYSLVKLVRIK